MGLESLVLLALFSSLAVSLFDSVATDVPVSGLVLSVFVSAFVAGLASLLALDFDLIY